MKRMLCLLISIVFLFSFPVFASAAETTVNQSIIHYDDGSYLVITIQETTARATGTKSGTAIYEYNNADGSVAWQATLKGTFTYNGSTATCTSSSCDITINASEFYVVSKTVGKSGGTATASVTMGRKFLGITIAQDAYELTLTCDKDGNLS